MKFKTPIVLLIGALLLFPMTHLHGQNTQRLKSILVEEPDNGNYIPRDSTNYIWTSGEGAESTNFRNFRKYYYDWYLNDAKALPDVIEEFSAYKDVFTEYFQFLWNDTTNTFEKRFRTTFELGSQGEVLKKETQVDDGEGGWIKGYKTEYQYNSNGKVISIELYVSPMGVNWENSDKMEVVYNSNGDLIKATEYKGLVNQQWQPEKKDTFIFAGSYLKEKWSTEWDALPEEWKDQLQDSVIYEYNSNGFCDKVTRYRNTYGNGPELYTVKSYFYNSNGAAITLLYENTNNATQTLTPFYKAEFTYNYDYPLEKVTYKWNSSTSEYDESRKNTFTYDGSLLKKIETKEWDDVSDSWVMDSHSYFGRKITFYYEDINTSGLNELTSDFEFKIYPNPSSDKVKIKAADGGIQNIRIINSKGQTVLNNQKTLNAQEVTVTVNHLSTGVYYLKVNNGVAEGLKKLIVK